MRQVMDHPRRCRPGCPGSSASCPVVPSACRAPPRLGPRRRPRLASAGSGGLPAGRSLHGRRPFRGPGPVRGGLAAFRPALGRSPGRPQSLEIGGSGPLWAAGPVRHQGLARVLDDPGADAYLFTGAWRKPLALDFDSRGSGPSWVGRRVSGSRTPGNPGMGLWAGTAGDRGDCRGRRPAPAPFFPRRPASTPGSPRTRPGPPGSWPPGRSGRDTGSRTAGRSLRGPCPRRIEETGAGPSGRSGSCRAKDFLWSGRLSGSSPGWKGLGGEGGGCLGDPDRRAPGPCGPGSAWRAGCAPAQTRTGIRTGRPWPGRPAAAARERWGLELEGSDAESDPPLRLEPALWAGYEGQAVRAAARMSRVREGAWSLTRTEVSASLGLGRFPSRSFAWREPGGGPRKVRAGRPGPRWRSLQAGARGRVRAGTPEWDPGFRRPALGTRLQPPLEVPVTSAARLAA
ncbi:MAG: hypothetical protein M0C28_43385 [Candidatus Moduliflexus flocculans]|nr:hypothetical protein [Candidatus Moduliflexus flocculans]